MDPSNSDSSAPSTSSRPGSSSGAFAYQTRLLARTSSTRSTGSVSRSNSLLSNPTGNSNTGPSRRWAPSHRVTNSVDVGNVRNRWEDRAREAAGVMDDSTIQTSTNPPRTPTSSGYNADSTSSIHSAGISPSKPFTEEQRTPRHLKRQTMPLPIIASPLSPNTTGVSIESDSTSSGFGSTHRIHLPSHRPPRTDSQENSTSQRSQTTDAFSDGRSSPLKDRSFVTSPTTPTRPTSATRESFTTSPLPSFLQRRPSQTAPDRPGPTSIIGTSVASRRNSYDSMAKATNPVASPPPTSTTTPPSSVMTPQVYRSSYMNTKKGSYGDNLRPSGRKLGNHLPRIASGDGNEDWQEETKKEDEDRAARRARRLQHLEEMSHEEERPRKVEFQLAERQAETPRTDPVPRRVEPPREEPSPRKRDSFRAEPSPRKLDSFRSPISPTKFESFRVDVTPPRAEPNPERISHRKVDPFPAPAPSPNDVAGIPGRLRLSRASRAPNTGPTILPSARLTAGLWADVERKWIQAYEYLCHVGEAQQWMEGCLGEELGFGVVEMDEGLRNGVALAKLVRVFQGDSVVRKIYEAPKLDFRHSDNINHFFNFVREIGLPEGFIFELIDLYNKKNIPKVIYCIHALGHLLSRRGMAAKMGNLLGRLKFSEEQLQATHKDLKDSGVAMPNFGNVGRELAKDLNEEPEVEVETEEERRDRLLLENEGSIIGLQARARGFVEQRHLAILKDHMRLAERHVKGFQALCRGLLVRRALANQRRSQAHLRPWAVALQAFARGVIIRRRFQDRLAQIRRTARYVTKVQSQLRGILQRRRIARLKAALQRSTPIFAKLQTVARAGFAKSRHSQITKSFFRSEVKSSIVQVQARIRGIAAREAYERRLQSIHSQRHVMTGLQAQLRGVLVRRQIRKQLAKLDDVSDIVLRMQSSARTFLARKRLLLLIRGLRHATPFVVGFQARARAGIARQHHKDLSRALAQSVTVFSVRGLQDRARSKLARQRHQEITRELEFVAPDVIGMQATVRGVLVRNEFLAWKQHLKNSQGVATILQALLRGAMQRRKFRTKLEYFKSNLSTFVKIQSLFRAKETREQYRQLTMGTNVTMGTIKNFVHLLDDSEADFQQEMQVERLRVRVVEAIRDNQVLESEVSDLEVRIRLVVQNVKSFEEIMKLRRSRDSTPAHIRSSLLEAHGDPFSGSNIDVKARRKLELYQQLFYLLQTHPEYLSRLFMSLTQGNVVEKNVRFAERAVLTLFGHGQDRREDFLLLKLLSLAVREEVFGSSQVDDIIDGHPLYMNVVVRYARPKQIIYARETFQELIRAILDTHDLDLEIDPSQIYRSLREMEELKTGVPNDRPKDVSFHGALEDPLTRKTYIQHLQTLQTFADTVASTILRSAGAVPYSVRYLARETLKYLRAKYPNAPESAYASCIGRLVYYRYINPVLIAPEAFDIVPKTIDPGSRRNLQQISRVLTQIASGVPFGDDTPSYIPINEYVNGAILRFSEWFLEVADVPDADTYFHAHEFTDATVQPKSIYISPNEIYTMHGLLSQYQNSLVDGPEDTLKVILTELDGVPNLDNEQLIDARDQAINLELTNRFSDLQDPLAEEKAMWVRAKRGVLAMLKVQPSEDLYASMLKPVTPEDEELWKDIIDAEVAADSRHHARRQASTAAPDYSLEDIRSQTFREIKIDTITIILQLENLGKVSRNDGFQGILNAVASDVRSKHRKRMQRKQEMESMQEALRDLAERKKYFEEQIESYHSYVKTSMETLQKGKGKKRLVIPFTKQYFHLRDLQRTGKAPQFGSFIYTAKQLMDKGILLSIDKHSPRQFDKLHLTLSSSTPGVFTLVLESSAFGGVQTRVATDDVEMEDLLQKKYEEQSSLSLFGGMVKVNLERFLFQINKKFYA